MFAQINKLSRGEICVANFIPPPKGASLGSCLVKKGEKGFKKWLWQPNLRTFLEMAVCFMGR